MGANHAMTFRRLYLLYRVLQHNRVTRRRGAGNIRSRLTNVLGVLNKGVDFNAIHYRAGRPHTDLPNVFRVIGDTSS